MTLNPEVHVCSRCREEFSTDLEFQHHAEECAPAVLPGESWEDYKARADKLAEEDKS